MRRIGLAAAAALLTCVPLGGCESGEEPAPAAAPVEGEAMDGLSPEQIRQQAEPLSPERAAELGIIDTTIHIEKLTSPGDSALIAGPPPSPVRDTAS